MAAQQAQAPNDEEPWGWKLRRHVEDAGRGGIAGRLDRILQVCGETIGKQVTFLKLYDFDEIPNDQKNRYRTFVLLMRIGQDPLSWGLSPEDLPEGLRLLYESGQLADLLNLNSRWNGDQELTSYTLCPAEWQYVGQSDGRTSELAA